MKIKKIFKVIFIIIIALIASLYYIYPYEFLIYPDKESKKVMQNVWELYEKNLDYSDKTLKFNHAMEAFSVNTEINVNRNSFVVTIENIPYGSVSSLSRYEHCEIDPNWSNVKYIKKAADERDDYYFKKYRFCYRPELELYLMIYNHYENDNLSADDIENILYNGDLSKSEQIKKYIEWYRSYGTKYYDCYSDKFRKISLDEDNQLHEEYYVKYRLAVETGFPSYSEWKEIFENFNKMNVIEEYRNSDGVVQPPY